MKKTILDFEISNTKILNEVVISGTLKPVRRLENPVEIITATF
jgi:outer membrane receptor for ferrienterochelin and colicins